MSGTANRVILVGNLCADVEVRSFQNGGRVANLRVATNETWNDRQTGERKERAEYHSVVIHSDGLVGVAEKYLRKGSKVYLEGKLATRKWADQQGNDRYSTEVVLQGPGAVMTMLDGPPQSGDRRDDNRQAGRSSDAAGYRQRGEQGYVPAYDDFVPGFD